MSGYDEALGRRAVACKAWRWTSGMLFRGGGRILYEYSGEEGTCPELNYAGMAGGGYIESLTFDQGGWSDSLGCDAEPFPDFTDAATRGCLLDLVRKAWGDPDAHPRPLGNDAGEWFILDEHGETIGRGVGEVEALLAALEAAP